MLLPMLVTSNCIPIVTLVIFGQTLQVGNVACELAAYFMSTSLMHRVNLCCSCVQFKRMQEHKKKTRRNFWGTTMDGCLKLQTEVTRLLRDPAKVDKSIKACFLFFLPTFICVASRMVQVISIISLAAGSGQLKCCCHVKL